MACWFAKWATGKRPCSGALARSGSSGRSARCSPCSAMLCRTLPVRAHPGKGSPLPRKRSDKAALAALEPRAHAFRVLRQLAKECLRGCEIVQLAKRVLQRAELAEEGPHCPRRKAVGKEIATVAQALQRNAHAMTLAAIRPIDAIGALLELAMSSLGGVARMDKDRVGRLRRRAPRVLLEP